MRLGAERNESRGFSPTIPLTCSLTCPAPLLHSLVCLSGRQDGRRSSTSCGQETSGLQASNEQEQDGWTSVRLGVRGREEECLFGVDTVSCYYNEEVDKGARAQVDHAGGQ